MVSQGWLVFISLEAWPHIAAFSAVDLYFIHGVNITHTRIKIHTIF